MIYNRLSSFMDASELNFSELSKLTGISRQALTSLANNQSGGIQFSTLEILLDFFDTDFNNFFYRPENTVTVLLDMPMSCLYPDGEAYSFSGDIQYLIQVEDENSTGIILYNVNFLYDSSRYLSGVIMKQDDGAQIKGIDPVSLLINKIDSISSIRIEHFFTDILRSFTNHAEIDFSDTVLFSLELGRKNIVTEIEMMDGTKFNQLFYPIYPKLKVPYPDDIDNTFITKIMK